MHQVPDKELQDLVLALLGFSFALVPLFLSVLPFQKGGMFTLCHCMLEVSSFDFTEASS